MNDCASFARFRSAALAGLAAMVVVAIGAPAVLAAETAVGCGNLLTGQAGDQLGWALDAAGDWLAVGAIGTNGKPGSVTLFQKLQPLSIIPPTDLRPGDQFGFSISISGDWMAVGAPFGDKEGVQDSGVVYLYQLKDRTWVKLAATDASRGDRFGAAVALSDDTLVVGAPDNSGDGSHAGAAYVFERQRNVWRQTKRLHAGDIQSFDNFGSSVAVDQNTIVVGSPFADHPGVLKNFGAVYVFGGADWVQEDKLMAGDVYRPNNIQFGSSVAIGGGRIVVGVPGDDEKGTDSGSAYIFKREGSIWKGQMVKADDPGQGEQFGSSVRTDGTRVVVGARFDGEGGPKAGAGYLFKETNGTWKQTQKVNLPGSAGAAFGQSAAILGERIFLGGYLFDVDSEVDSGAVATCFPAPSLTCSTKSGPLSAKVGDIVTYNVEVANQGGTAATGVVLEDPAQPGLRSVSVSGPCVLFPCNLGKIDPEKSAPPVRLQFRVLAGCWDKILNVATLTAENAEKTTCQAETAPIPDLAVDVSAPASLPGGDELEISVLVSNAGPPTALNVPLDLTIAGAVPVREIIPAGCAAVLNEPGHFLCAEIACGAAKKLVFRVRAPACPVCSVPGPITATAMMPLLPTADAVSSNNQDSATIDVSCPPRACTDLSISKKVNLTTARPGQTLVYEIAVENRGNVAVAATVTDLFPENLTDVRWCRNCSPNLIGQLSENGDLHDTLPLAAGEKATYRALGTVSPMCAGTLVNTATISPPQGIIDPVDSNNSAEVTTEVRLQPGVSAVGILGSHEAFEGGPVRFTFVLFNGGPNAQADNQGDEFTDTLPAELTLVSAGPTSGTTVVKENTVTWNGAIPACGAVTITVDAKVNPDAVKMMKLENQGTVFFDADGNGTNESSILTDDPDLPGPQDPSVVKILSAALIPTLSETALAALSLLLAALAVLRLRRRSP